MSHESQIAHIRVRTFGSGPYLEKLMAELDRAAISARIKQARREAGLSQRELADLLHGHWRTVQEWENVKNPNVPWDRLEDIARATGRDRNWLLHDDQATPETITSLQADVQ